MSDAPTSLALTGALDLVREELLGMDPSTLLPINVDIVAAATLVLGVVEELPSYREGLLEIFEPEWLRPLDRLELLAHAALQAHARHRACEAPANLTPLVRELTKLREVLAAEVRSLVVRDVLDGEVIGALTGLHGPKNLCVDVLQLVAVFRTNWPTLEGKTGVTPDHVERADVLCARLAKAIGKREQAGLSAAADLRNRAFTLLSRTYDDARRLLTFLRWREGDHDEIAPTFWSGRQTKRRKSGVREVDVEPQPQYADADSRGIGGE